jgi:DNA polymerase elongation subunit (family B)
MLFMIYDADYIFEEKTIVRLFEKNGKKAIRHDTTLEPYIYGLAEENIRNTLRGKRDSSIRSHLDTHKMFLPYEKR